MTKIIMGKAYQPAAFRKSKLADRGKVAEDAVQAYLKGWEERDPRREFNRLVDTKAAGRIIKAAAADFEFFCSTEEDVTYHGLIEVKETKHEHRLDRARLTQAPHLRKRIKCGGSVFVLVHHSTIGRWRCLTPEQILDPSTKGSWDLRDNPAFMDVAGCLWASHWMWGRP